MEHGHPWRAGLEHGVCEGGGWSIHAHGGQGWDMAYVKGVDGVWMPKGGQCWNMVYVTGWMEYGCPGGQDWNMVYVMGVDGVWTPGGAGLEHGVYDGGGWSMDAHGGRAGI